jgi:hypothetical protein
MSDDKSAKPEKEKKEKGTKKPASFMGWFLLCMPIMLVLGFFYAPLFLLVVLMAPAWFALMADSGEDRALAVCVGSGTLAGTMFFLAHYFLNPMPIETALSMVQQPQAWLYSLAGAAFGATIFYIIPLLVIESVYLRNVAHKKYLDDAQKKLIEDWGDGVRG